MAVDAGQLLQRGDFDALVDLVDRRVDRTDFNDLRADVGDEAPIRGAAGGRKLGVDATNFADRRSRCIGEWAATGQEGTGAKRPFDRIIETVFIENGVETLLQALGRAGGGKAKIELINQRRH